MERTLREESELIKKTTGGLDGFMKRLRYARTLPNSYEATTIHDFLEHVGDVKPSYGLHFLQLVLAGKATITIGSPVNFRFAENENGIISDMTDSLEVLLNSVIAKLLFKGPELKEGMDLYDTTLAYQPRNGKIWLHYYSDHGLPTGEPASPSRLYPRLAFSRDVQRRN